METQKKAIKELVDELKRQLLESQDVARARRVQAAALRRENDILAGSISRLRAELAARCEGALAAAAREAELRSALAELTAERDRLSSDNIVISASLSFWRGRKTRIFQLIPAVVRPPIIWAYKRLARR
jgi:hypothetical protein